MTTQQTPLSDTRRVIGQSSENRAIELVTFGPADVTQWDTLFMGAIHGDEGISAALLEVFIHDYPKNAEALGLSGKSVAILPVLNPDGLAANTRMTSNKVDLNRNCPTQDWSERDQDTGQRNPAP